jgi:hypothetical protein
LAFGCICLRPSAFSFQLSAVFSISAVFAFGVERFAFSVQLYWYSAVLAFGCIGLRPSAVFSISAVFAFGVKRYAFSVQLYWYSAVLAFGCICLSCKRLPNINPCPGSKWNGLIS